ncbi:MAG: TetR family transcriptional regulator [Rhizobiales bacterium]|nr:TetR family transcriptional regulator [Hyphomicrobiales bacterium]
MPAGTSQRKKKTNMPKTTKATSVKRGSVKSAGRKNTKTASEKSTPPKAPGGQEGVRERIVSAALTLFAKSGFDGTTITQIGREAGVVSPLIYYYFSDKDELWRAAAEYAISDWANIMRQSQKELIDADPVTVLKVQVRRYVYFVARHRKFGRLVNNEAGAGVERLKWLIKHHVQPIQKASDSLFELAVAQGLMRPVNMSFMTQFVVGGVSYFMSSPLLLKEVYGIDPHDEKTIDAFADFIIEIIFGPLLTEKGRGVK